MPETLLYGEKDVKHVYKAEIKINRNFKASVPRFVVNDKKL